MPKFEYKQIGVADAELLMNGVKLDDVTSFSVLHRAGELPRVVVEFLNVDDPMTIESRSDTATFGRETMRICKLHGGPLDGKTRAVVMSGDPEICTPTFRFDVAVPTDDCVRKISTVDYTYSGHLPREASDDFTHYEYVASRA